MTDFGLLDYCAIVVIGQVDYSAFGSLDCWIIGPLEHLTIVSYHFALNTLLLKANLCQLFTTYKSLCKLNI